MTTRNCFYMELNSIHWVKRIWIYKRFLFENDIVLTYNVILSWTIRIFRNQTVTLLKISLLSKRFLYHFKNPTNTHIYSIYGYIDNLSLLLPRLLFFFLLFCTNEVNSKKLVEYSTEHVTFGQHRQTSTNSPRPRVCALYFI